MAQPSASPSPEVGIESTAMVFTNELLLDYQRCKRRAYLNQFGNLSDQTPPSDYLHKLRQDSLRHQQEVLRQEGAIVCPEYAHRDWKTGAAHTLDLMWQGVDRIGRGVLEVSIDDRIHWVTYPKLLVKQPGPSMFGDWHYVPVDIRLGRRPKLDYQIVAAFHAYLLSFVQGTQPETSWLILRQRGQYAVDLEATMPRLHEVLDDWVATFLSRQEPEVFIAHSRCDLCQWFDHCYQIAQARQHLSLLPGVTPTRYVHLKALGVTTLEALSSAEPRQFEGLPGFGPQVAHRLVRQAQSTLSNQALPYVEAERSWAAADFQEPLRSPLLDESELPTAEVELFFDIEAAPEHQAIYLHGVLVVDRGQKTQTFHPLLAETPDLEQQAWQQFLELVGRYPNAPIFHFCPYEVQTLQKLAKTYDTPEELVLSLVERCVDLHERVTRVAVMPVESYALKPIARWIGFEWRDQQANGAQSICWYDQWLKTGDRTYLNAILRYNEDDCRATYALKDWLTSFVAEHAIE